MQYKLKKIRSDASFREFFRLKKGNKTSIIVTAKKERYRNLIAYSAINKFSDTYAETISNFQCALASRKAIFSLMYVENVHLL